MKAGKALLFAPALALPLMFAPAASASTDSMTYMANLTPVPLNGQTSAHADLTLVLRGSTATITEHAHGLAPTFMGQPFPHVQHIHGMGGTGQCPTASADKNGDGVITTTEGGPAYGGIDTTLSTSGDTSPAAATDVKTAPGGAAFAYTRTVQLSSQTLSDIRAGKAVIVVHGLNPATAPKAATTEKSELVKSLPQAATAPALCGRLVVSPMTSTPSGGVGTGGAPGSGGPAALPLYLLGAAGLAGAGGLTVAARRRSQQPN
jgi:hypothetical protein